MEKKLEVSEEFVREAYRSACYPWKKKIQEQFPGIFPLEYENLSKFIREGEIYTLVRVGYVEERNSTIWQLFDSKMVGWHYPIEVDYSEMYLRKEDFERLMSEDYRILFKPFP